MNLEEARLGSSNVLLEDPDVACVLDMVKEKLSGHIVSGLLEPSKLDPVESTLENINRILRASTKKRPERPPHLVTKDQLLKKDREKMKTLIAETMTKVLIERGRSDIDDYDLAVLLCKVIENTVLDDGRYVIPPKHLQEVNL